MVKSRNVMQSKILFNLIKFCVIIVNLMHICFTSFMVYNAVTQLSDREVDERDPKKLELLEVNRTVLVISTIMAFALCLVGIVGAIKER